MGAHPAPFSSPPGGARTAEGRGGGGRFLPFFLVLAAILVFGLFSLRLSPTARHRRMLETRFKQIEGEVQREYTKSLILERRRNALKTDPVAMERELRHRTARARPGETAVVIPRDFGVPPPPAPATGDGFQDDGERASAIFHAAAALAAAVIIILFIAVLDAGR